ncbi:MAG: DUF1156 domain-containing protein [Acidimicrobiaceae bacterium]|nr:DUF1156 domain-containing protein [Acidimicrobiaceae bacterium]MYD06640.1 DUF1156 domain-containing protein [Acidimicrobiaceae bacterium]MYI58746.1 DUF1156 domain-containing protein [Acidimicrobiaceae bacterium]
MIESDRPRLLIEDWFPVAELGIESVRERAAASALPPIYFLHVWWARRPLVASAGAILASLLPAWSEELADKFGNHDELTSRDAYQYWFLHLCGIWGDPVAARARIAVATEQGVRLGAAAYGYKQAYKNSLHAHDIKLLHEVLEHTWGRVPEVCDPTAGGGSIPHEAVRYRLPAHANDLNPVAAAILKAGVEIPSQFGPSLQEDLRLWGSFLVDRLNERLATYFELPDESDNNTYIFARTVTCPRSGKTVPLVSDWALRRGKKPVAVRLITERAGIVLEEPEFEIVEGAAARFDTQKAGTWSRGKAISPWDHLVIDNSYIKDEAQAGRMGDVMYAVAIRGAGGRGFRAPTEVDLRALDAAEAELARLLPEWERDDILPSEVIPSGNKTNEPHNYGMTRWRDMFTPRQLLFHGTFVQEYRQLVTDIHAAMDCSDRADAVAALIGMMPGKALNWNARLASWNVGHESIRSVFDSHNFAFKNTFAEFEGGSELPAWTLSQLLDAYTGIAGLLAPNAEPGMLDNTELPPVAITVTGENAGNLASLADESQTLVCIDPPYYDNVMYAELADYFYVWHKRTLGRLWPDLFAVQLTNKDDEAVTNRARFAHAGRRAAALADHDYTAKMAAIFAECRRVLTPEGVMTVMFTHKRADAWDSLGAALLQAGFEVRTSWPVHTEREQSLHQARQNAVKSTVFLSCRKRAEKALGEDTVYLDDIAADIRGAAGNALERGHAQGLVGVDLLLSTYGPALSVLSSQWPVYAAEADETTGRSRLLRPEEALAVARTEVLRRERMRLVGREIEFDPLTDFTLLAWRMFGAREFPYDEARKLALSISDLDLDDVVRAKLLAIKSGVAGLTEPRLRLRRDTDAHLPGIDRSRTVVDVWVDAVHTAAYITAQDGVGAAKRWLDERDLTENPVFEACLQAFVRALPNTKHQGEWNVPEAGHLHSLVRTYFKDIELPPEPVEFETEELSLPGIADD